MKAIWNNQVIAESDRTITLEDNVYFPPDSLIKKYFIESLTHTICHWKGVASYYSVVVEGDENLDAAWFYPDPSPKAKQIRHYVAFWKGVTISE